MGPSREQMDRLLTALEGAPARPARRLTRRGLAVLAACAALVVTAVAAGPAISAHLQEYLGDFTAYLAPVEGTAADQGLEMRVVGSLSDGVFAKLYVAVTDRTGDRLDGRTDTHISVNGVWRSNAARMGTRQLSYDPETKTALYEVECEGMDYSKPVSITAGRFQPQYYSNVRVYPDLSGLTARPVPCETGPNGEVILAMENPQTFEGAPGLSVSMGVGSDGLLHVRSQLTRDYSGDVFFALPLSKATGENYQDESDVITQLPDGCDMALGRVTADTVADIESIQVYGTYVGSAEKIEGQWKLENVTLENAPVKAAEDLGTYGVFVLERVQVSSLGVSVLYHNTP